MSELLEAFWFTSKLSSARSELEEDDQNGRWCSRDSSTTYKTAPSSTRWWISDRADSRVLTNRLEQLWCFQGLVELKGGRHGDERARKWRNGEEVARLGLAFWRNLAPFDVAYGPDRSGQGRSSTVVSSPLVVVVEKGRSDELQ